MLRFHSSDLSYEPCSVFMGVNAVRVPTPSTCHPLKTHGHHHTVSAQPAHMWAGDLACLVPAEH